MTKYSTWERPWGPMSPAVATLAGMVFELPDGWMYEQEPVGLLIGEQPGVGHNPRLPLWPYPPNSAGDRLYRMSGMPITDYLNRLARANMALRPVGKWDAREAAGRLYAIGLGIPRADCPVVLCGARARNAYNLLTDQNLDWFEVDPARTWVSIPHPSGRNLAYRDPENVARARRILRWAAGLEEL